MDFSRPRYDYLERALVLCAKLARTPRSDWDEQVRRDHDRLNRVLRVIYAEIAFLQSQSIQGVSADPDHPGYLIVPADGAELRVPFHLFEALPAAELLHDFVQIAATIRANTSSVICISGSCASYGDFGAISDFDLCEYLSPPHARDAITKALARAETIDTERLVCFGMHLFEVRYNAAKDLNEEVDRRSTYRPWLSSPSAQPAFMEILPRAKKAKFDFLANTGPEGLIVTTNMTLVPDSRGDHVLLDSHAGQEVPVLFDGSFVPRELADPLALGRYVEFLCDQIDATLDAAHLAKAAKRAHSLARLLTRNVEADRIVKSMRANDFFIDAAIAARLAVARHIDVLSDRSLRERLIAPMVETFRLLCSRATSAELAALVKNGKDLDDLTAWINNLDQYMHTKTAQAATIEADLREFVGDVREQIAAAGT